MKNIRNHLIYQNTTLTEAVKQLEILKSNAILFVVDDQQKLIGSLTDGDIRRAILGGKSLNIEVKDCIQDKPAFIRKGNINLEKIIYWRNRQFKIIPIVDNEMKIVDVLNFSEKRSLIPVDCVIMAGGKGERLKPLTENKPKPLLPVGEKPIIEHGINHYVYYGIENIHVTTNYLSEQLDTFIASKKSDEINLKGIQETKFMGTIGAIKLISDFHHDVILVSNSDLLTNVDIEQFYLSFVQNSSDCAILSVPFKIEVPYGVLEVDNETLTRIDEKPTYTYNTNGGMYLIKKELLNLIPNDTAFSAVDFIELLMRKNKKITLFQHYGYWLDIGNHNDYKRAQHDIAYVYTNKIGI